MATRRKAKAKAKAKDRPRCAGTTRKGKPCPWRALPDGPDPDDVHRCHQHSIRPERIAQRKSTGQHSRDFWDGEGGAAERARRAGDELAVDEDGAPPGSPPPAAVKRGPANLETPKGALAELAAIIDDARANLIDQRLGEVCVKAAVAALNYHAKVAASKNEAKSIRRVLKLTVAGKADGQQAA